MPRSNNFIQTNKTLWKWVRCRQNFHFSGTLIIKRVAFGCVAARKQTESSAALPQRKTFIIYVQIMTLLKGNGYFWQRFSWDGAKPESCRQKKLSGKIAGKPETVFGGKDCAPCGFTIWCTCAVLKILYLNYQPFKSCVQISRYAVITNY